MTNANAKSIEEKMRFAKEACKDTNTYTSEEEFLRIVEAGSSMLLENKEYVREIFPALNWE